jgi:hypothetical protein
VVPPPAKGRAETTYAVGLGPAVSAPRHYVRSTLDLPLQAQPVHLPPAVEFSPLGGAAKARRGSVGSPLPVVMRAVQVERKCYTYGKLRTLLRADKDRVRRGKKEEEDVQR